MQLLVEKLLQQARLENRLEITPQLVSVDALFQRLAEDRDIALTAKAITLRWQESGVTVNGDSELLGQALGNLIDNAIDFTRTAVKFPAVEMRNEEAWLSVTDNGSGIPDFALERIFERFYSLPRDDGHKSSGLGRRLFVKSRVYIRAILVCTIALKAAWSRRYIFTVPSHNFKHTAHSPLQ